MAISTGDPAAPDLVVAAALVRDGDDFSRADEVSWMQLAVWQVFTADELREVTSWTTTEAAGVIADRGERRRRIGRFDLTLGSVTTREGLLLTLEIHRR